MKKKSLLTALLLLLAVTCSLSCEDSATSEPGAASSSLEKIPLPDTGPANPYGVVEDKGIPITRDGDPKGIKLYADVYRPDSDERFPSLLMASAYRRETIRMMPPRPEWLASQGYVTILVDVLGTGSSEGGWESLSLNEIEYLTWINDDWIPEQGWSNGKVGMYGGSYMAILAYLAAGQSPKHLKAIFPCAQGGDGFYHTI